MEVKQVSRNFVENQMKVDSGHHTSSEYFGLREYLLPFDSILVEEWVAQDLHHVDVLRGICEYFGFSFSISLNHIC